MWAFLLQVMEIVRNKANIRMVLSEKLVHPDAKRLRLVKARLHMMKESARSQASAEDSPEAEGTKLILHNYDGKH